MNMTLTTIVQSILAALVIVALSALIFEGCTRAAERRQEITLKCIEQAETSAEAVICRNRVEAA